MGTKIKFSKQEIDWIERTADIESARIFQNFGIILNQIKEVDSKIDKTLFDKQIQELIELYGFLKTLRTKLELWDCRFDIDTEIEYPDKEDKNKNG